MKQYIEKLESELQEFEREKKNLRNQMQDMKSERDLTVEEFKINLNAMEENY